MSCARLIGDQGLTTKVPANRVTDLSGRELIIFADSSVMEVERDVRRTTDSLYFSDVCTSRRLLSFFPREDAFQVDFNNFPDKGP